MQREGFISPQLLSGEIFCVHTSFHTPQRVVEVKEEEVAKWGPSNFRGSWVRIYRQVSNLRPGWLSLIPSKAQIKVKPPWYQTQGPLSAVCTGTGMAVTRSHTGPVPVPVDNDIYNERQDARRLPDDRKLPPERKGRLPLLQRGQGLLGHSSP